MNKNAFLFILILLLSPCFSQEHGSSSSTSEYESFLRTGNFSLNGEFLWWRPYARIPYALTSKPISFGTTLASTEEKTHKVDLGFQPGLRLSIGLYLPVETWRLYWWYTRFRTSDTKTTVPKNNERLSPIWETVPIFASEPAVQPQAKAKQMLNYNVFDWSLYNFLSWHKSMTFIPSFGLRTAWIDNDLTVEYSGQNTAPINFPVRDESRLKNHFRAIGLRGGFWVNWIINNHWSIFSNTFMSLLLSRITERHKQVFTLVDNVGGIVSSDVSNANRFLSIKSAYELNIGVLWGMKLKRTFFGLEAAYEAHLWPDQIQYMLFSPNKAQNSLSNPVNFYTSDLSMQGFCFKAKLEL